MTQDAIVRAINNRQGLEAVREAIECAQPEKYVPYGFAIRPTGVYRLDESGDIAVCDPLHIEALARDSGGNNWGRLLVWRDPDGRTHEWAMPNNMLASDGAEYRRFLLDSGLGIRGGRKAQNALHDYIMMANPPARAVSVNLPGWHGKRYIAVDGTTYGQGSDRMLLQASSALPRIDKKGTLGSWRDNVAAYAQGNSRLVFSISAAFAGPLLSFANEGSGGFHFAGESSGGKTTALCVASSVWGFPLRSWRTTDNAAESWARFANDSFLAIDELGQVDGRAADQMAYMLGNGQTKGRANRDGIARDTTEFRLMFLSTGEIGLAEKIGEGKKKAKAGQTVRMIEIPADAGQGMRLFEKLHSYASAEELANYLRQATEENRGHAASVWLEKLAAMDGDELRRSISILIKEWMDAHVPPGADGQVRRAARRFALVAMAGELATSFGIVQWQSGEVGNAAAQCFNDWLTARGGAGSHEAQDGIRDILGFIEKHGNSRFQDVNNITEKIYDQAGWKRATDDAVEYFITRATLQSEILGSSHNLQGVIKLAIETELMVPDADGKATRPVRLPGIGQKRVLCIVPAQYREVTL